MKSVFAVKVKRARREGGKRTVAKFKLQSEAVWKESCSVWRLRVEDCAGHIGAHASETKSKPSGKVDSRQSDHSAFCLS